VAIARGPFIAARNGEQAYESVGGYGRRRLPERAVVLTILHSGSVRYDSGRLTVRWMFIPERPFDGIVEDLQRRGLRSPNGSSRCAPRLR